MNTPGEFHRSDLATTVTPARSRAFGGVWRLTVPRFLTLRHLVTCLGVGAALAAIGFGLLHGRQGPSNYLAWLVTFYLTFLVPVAVFIRAGGVVRDDMLAGTADYVLTRPIRRPLFLVSRYLAHVLCVEIEFLLGTGILLAGGLARHAPALASAVPSLLVAQIGLVMAFSGFGFLCGAITGRYAIVGLIYGAIVEIGVGEIPTELNRISMIHHVRAMLQPFVSASGSTLSASGDSLTTPGPFSTFVVLIGFALVTLAAAAALFSMREMTGTNDA